MTSKITQTCSKPQRKLSHLRFNRSKPQFNLSKKLTHRKILTQKLERTIFDINRRMAALKMWSKNQFSKKKSIKLCKNL